MKIVQHQRGFPHGLSENTQEYKGKGAAYDSKRCCYICPSDSCPRRPWSKGANVQGAVIRGDFGPMRLLSNEAFTSNKLVQIIFFHIVLDFTILLYHKMEKNNMNSH